MNEIQFAHLSDIGFRRWLPSAVLRPYVRWFWSIQTQNHISTPRHEFMHADGSVGLLFNFGDEFDLNGRHHSQTVILNNVWTQSHQLKVAGNMEAFGIVFRPGGAYPVLGLPINELSETAVLTNHLPTGELACLHEKIYGAATLKDRMNIVESWLVKRLQQAQEPSPVIFPSLTLIDQTRGQLAVQTIADSVNISTRQLARLFKTQVGISPKKFARIVRVQQARGALKQNDTRTLAEVAYDFGFYDQPHFIREFTAVIGMTPAAYSLRQQKKENNR